MNCNLPSVNRYLGVSVLALCLLPACTPVVSHPAAVQKLQLDTADITAAPYHIGVGDEMEIKFFSTPELNETVQVRPDGKISIMFAQDIKAAGKTPEELAGVIKKKIDSHVKHPDMVIIMHGFASQKIYVGGEVTKPGPVQMTGRETLMQALDDAGWMTPAAKRDEVVLVRRGDDGKEAVYPINISKMVSGEDMTQNVIVRAGDLILVPPSSPVAFDRWVDQNVRQALPFSTNVGAVYTNQYQTGNR